jgi:hypothetical protein
MACLSSKREHRPCLAPQTPAVLGSNMSSRTKEATKVKWQEGKSGTVRRSDSPTVGSSYLRQSACGQDKCLVQARLDPRPLAQHTLVCPPHTRNAAGVADCARRTRWECGNVDLCKSARSAANRIFFQVNGCASIHMQRRNCGKTPATATIRSCFSCGSWLHDYPFVAFRSDPSQPIDLWLEVSRNHGKMWASME